MNVRHMDSDEDCFFRDGFVEGRERGKEGTNTEAERREIREREATGVNSMVTEKGIITVVWMNVRKMTSRERQSEIE